MQIECICFLGEIADTFPNQGFFEDVLVTLTGLNLSHAQHHTLAHTKSLFNKFFLKTHEVVLLKRKKEKQQSMLD